ncbi:cadherin-like domain-containing protein [bacterium]|nr:cadherin-like domain-containing protein [bacterium]
MKKYLFLWLVLVGIRGITAQNIVQAEYFIDIDPGLGNATPVPFTPNNDVALSFSADISGLPNGFHTLYFRSKDVNGNWSVLHAKTIFTAYDDNTPAAVNLVQMEYFIDNDPGLGNGTSVSIIPGTNVIKSFSIDMAGMSGGFHTLFVRSRDANGLWNVAPASVFYRAPDAIVDPLADIVKMEYFIDNDPGFGNAADVPVVAGSNVTKSFSIDMNNVSGGFHTLYIRTKDADGSWNVAPASVFYRVPDAIVDPLANIVKMEYFVDTDPGFGSATNVGISPGTNITPGFSIDMTAVSGGFHTLYVRTQDTDGLWNVAPASPFYRVPDAIVDPLADIVKMEYFIDNDPGLGFGNDIPVTAGADITKSITLGLAGVSGGFHTLYIRSKDTDGNWNLLQAKAFYKTPDGQSHTSSPVVSIDYYFTKGGTNTSKYSYTGFVPSYDVQTTFNPLFGDLMADSTYDMHISAKDSAGNSSVLYSTQLTIDPLWLVIPNNNPVAVNDISTATAGAAKVISVLNNDSDIDGDELTIISVSTPLHGTAVKNAGDTTITYTALITYSGSDLFTYSISDGKGGLDTATVSVTVAPGGTLTISTSVLQNPALSKYADFYVIADTTLSASPAVKLFVGSDSTSIAMSATSNVRIYKGAITFTQSGNYTLRSQATAVNGASSTVYHAFNVALSKPGLLAVLSSLNGKALLKIGSKAVKEETYFTAFQNEDALELIYEFGPKAVLNEAVELTVSYDPSNWPDAGKLFIYHKEGDNWTRLRTQVYTGELRVKARVGALGKFKLGYDASYEGTNIVPAVFALKQNYPNPFNPSTTITYDVPEDTKLNLTIYNLLGQKVKTLYSGSQIAGSYKTLWNGTNDRGQAVASGIYFYRLETQSFIKTQKMLLIK